MLVSKLAVRWKRPQRCKLHIWQTTSAEHTHSIETFVFIFPMNLNITSLASSFAMYLGFSRHDNDCKSGTNRCKYVHFSGSVFFSTLCLIFMILVSLESVKKYSHVVAQLPQRLKSTFFLFFFLQKPSIWNNFKNVDFCFEENSPAKMDFFPRFIAHIVY